MRQAHSLRYGRARNDVRVLCELTESGRDHSFSHPVGMLYQCEDGIYNATNATEINEDDYLANSDQAMSRGTVDVRAGV